MQQKNLSKPKNKNKLIICFNILIVIALVETGVHGTFEFGRNWPFTGNLCFQVYGN